MSDADYPLKFVTALELRHAQEQACGGDTFTAAAEDDTAETNDEDSDPGRSRQGSPGMEQVSNDNSESHSHKSTDGGRRTDLRTVDDHSSWKAVYRACGVRWEGHE
jgi:hypothetical protein